MKSRIKLNNNFSVFIIKSHFLFVSIVLISVLVVNGYQNDIETDDEIYSVSTQKRSVSVSDDLDLGEEDALCPQNREEASARGRQCLRKCKTDADCISSRKRCLCDGQCGWSCVRPDLNCDELTAIEDGQFKLNGNYFGARVTYTCNEEFYMSGARERVCQGDASWSDQAPECKKKAQCNIPLTVPHARHSAPLDQMDFEIDATVQYSCFPGYESKGFTEAKCLFYNNTAQWFGPDLKCIPKSCGHPGDIENGIRDGIAHTFTSRITYSCNDGYELVGRANRYCQSNGQWSGVLPSCRPVQCPIPEDPINGRAIYTSVSYDSVVKYECKYGFKLHGPQNRSCTSNKQWSDEQPKCQEIDCGSPGVLNNGYLEVRRTILGSTVHFKCFDGMTFVGDYNSTTCLDNGTWSNPLPNCYAPCLVPEVENGRVNLFPVNQMVSHGQVIKVDCKPQYELHYNTTEAACNNSSWTHIPQCVPARCKAMPDKPKNGLVIAPKTDHGMKALYRCRDGFTLEGPNVTECNFGKWLGPLPKCVEVYCPFPGFIENGKVLLVGHMGMYDYRPYVKKVSNNKQILFECERGFYILNGPPGATCVDGQWSPQDLPQCVRGSHPKMRWLRSADNKRKRRWVDNNYVFWSQHSKRSRSRRHQKFKPSCKPLKETQTMKISIVKFGIGNDTYPHGTRLKNYCSNGYVSNIGNLTAKCAKGVWKPRQPDCLIAPCLTPYAENGYYYHRNKMMTIAHKISHGDAIRLDCMPGHQIQGQPIVRCWYGEWTKPQPQCISAPCSLPNIRNGYYSGGYRSGLTISHGSVIEFHCKSNYVRGVQEPPRCFEGRLMPEPPHCIEHDLIMNTHESKAINADESVIVAEEFDQIKAVVNSSVNKEEMLWCEPPEKLKNILKFESVFNKNHFPLISIAQINSNEWNSSSNITTTSDPLTTTNQYLNEQSSINASEPQKDINITELYQNLVNHTLENTEGLQTNKTSDNESEPKPHPHGTEIVFKCLPAANGMRNTWTIICQDGGWIGRASKCEDDLEALKAKINNSCVYMNSDPNIWAFIGDQRINEFEELSAGTELIIRCKDIGKYNLIGSKRRKCVYGEWDGQTPQCFGLSQENDYALEKPPTILFRHQLGPIAQSPEGKLIVYPGTILHLECLWKRKFGAPVWEWSHSYRKYNQDWTTEAGRDSGLEFRLSIFHAQKEDSGFYTCRTPNFHRHSVEIVVKAIHCQPLQETEGLKIINPNTKMNSKALFTCRPGMSLNGSDSSVCLPSGNWSDPTPSCWITECPNILSDPLNDTNSSDNYTENSSVLKITLNGRLVGDMATFSCPIGYGLKGNSEISCLESGHWSAPVPICQEVFCEPPNTPKHGYIQGDQIKRFRGSDIIQFACEPGFMLEGNPIVICQENSRWSGPPPKCVPACTYPGTTHGGIISVVKFFYNVNETVNFECADGYEIKGKSTLKCLDNGRWSSAVPECNISRKG